MCLDNRCYLFVLIIWLIINSYICFILFYYYCHIYLFIYNEPSLFKLNYYVICIFISFVYRFIFNILNSFNLI